MLENNAILLERAIQIAREAHFNQRDKAGFPYLLHPLRIMLKMDSVKEMIIAVLHDVVEDSQWTLDDLRKEKFSEDIVSAVDSLTRRAGESYDNYIDRVKRNPLAIRVKLGDLEDNMNIRRLDRITEQHLEKLKQYHRAYAELRQQAF